MTREEAISILCGVVTHYNAFSEESEAICMAIKALEQTDVADTNARPKGKWIPCSERLPTLADGRDVLVNVISDDRVYDIILADVETVGTIYRKGWINAWMPLPQPYTDTKGETNDQ